MTAPIERVVQVEYQNPRSKNPLVLPIILMNNTPDEEIARNITINSARDLEWIKRHDAHDGVAVLVGGGGSIDDEVETIRNMKGATVFAMNAASNWCQEHGIEVDYQFILDAKDESRSLIDHKAKAHLIGSQVNPKTMEAIENPIVWQCNTGDIERYFPKEKIERGGYCLLSGGSAVGNSSMSAVYALGYREFHIFGFDSCHKEGKSHAYDQPMNRFLPTVRVTWGGKEFTSSVCMKAHAEDFQITSQALKRLGCNFTLYGEGLLQAMYNTPTMSLSEQEKYQAMWNLDTYRSVCPGEHIVDEFIEHAKPNGIIIDYGCGTGRTSLALTTKGFDVMLIDFTDNCRDQEAMPLPFIQWDLTRPIPAKAEYGICTDVMEYIPTADVDTVLNNIMTSGQNVFFQISTVDDRCGELIGHAICPTVKPYDWWLNKFSTELGHHVEWSKGTDDVALFYVTQ